MLIIQRPRNRSIYLIDGEKKIKITYIGSPSGLGRIGIEAPKDIKILRDDQVDFDEDEDGVNGNF